MALSTQLISQFAKMANAKNSKKTPNTNNTVYGKIVVYNSRTYAQLDGSDLLTPVETTSSVKDGDRVTVKIENHTAIVTGNLSDPSASSGKLTEAANQISEFEIIIAHRITAEELEVTNAYIENLKAISAKFEEMSAVTAEIEELQVKLANIDHLTAKDIEALNAELENIRAEFGSFGNITTEDLEAANAEIDNLKAYVGEFTYVSTDVLEAIQASIKDLDVGKLSAEEAEIKYANIDFTNIDMAAVEELFTKSGIIKDLIVGDQSITGELVGVTIKGDLIEANTLKADKLVVKGSDGIYYKLNIEAGAITNPDELSEEELEKFQNGLSGTAIIAKSITAEKVAVDDLVAFGATIGGFHITDNSLYSGVKESVDNTTRGVYLDNDGQIAFGDANHHIMYYYDEETETYKLIVAADSVIFGGGKTIESEFSSVNETLTQTSNNSFESATKLEQLRALLSQVVTDENGNSLMIETPESYVLTTTTLSSVTGTLVEGATTTTGEEVYLATDATNSGTYYSIVDSVYYVVDYTPATCTFDISELEKAITDANSGLSSLTGQMNTIDGTVSAIQQAVDDLSLVGGYIYIDEEFDLGDGDTVPAIVLGESDSDFKVVITNKQIAFMEGSSVPAYISGQTLIAQNIEVKQQLTQGGFSWVSHDGNLGLIWTGPVNAAIAYNVGFTDYEVGATTALIGEEFNTRIVVRPYDEASMAEGSLYCYAYYGTPGAKGAEVKNCEITENLIYDTELGTYVYTADIYIPLVTGDIMFDIIYF